MMALAPELIAEPTLALDKPFYSPSEVAEIAKVSPATIHNWIKAGKLVAIRLSERTYRIPRKSVLRLFGSEEAREPVYIAHPDAIVD